MDINNKIKNTKIFKNKLFMILIGIILSFVLLELFLQTTSFVITEVIKYKSNEQIKSKLDDKNIIKILCIGESTTFRQYPTQLKEYLKKHSNKKFEIIDIGKPGAMLQYVNSKLESNIEQYKPDIIITMIGINQASHIKNKNEKIYKKYKFKTLELLYLLKKHLKFSSYKDIYMDKKNKIINLIDEFYEYNDNKKTLNEFDEDIEQSVAFVQRILDDINSNNIDKINYYISALELIIKYWKSKEYPIELFKMLKKDIDLEVKEYVMSAIFSFSLSKDRNINDNLKEDTLKELINILKQSKDIDEIQNYYYLIIYRITELDLSLYKNYIVQLYDLFLQKKVVDIEELYSYLETNNIDVVKPQQREVVEENDNELIENNMTITLNNDEIKNYYLKIAETILNKNITYICMDYPTMPIQELKDFFKDTVYYDRIIFVSNEENFNKVLKVNNYNKLFLDNFAGTFGHCTDLGNSIIAENVGKIILDITDK